ncbi:MAG: hypothetical protein KAV87_14930 [Desulfobacteraceae bacterium]|nr:hypothetical protein [Desulfobacteraceae bacterium]
MKRYGIKRSPYPDKFQARAIELLRKAESGELQASTIFDLLSDEFSRNKKIDKRLKNGQLTIKVIRRWAIARPDLPEIMRGETVRTFEQVAFAETAREMTRQTVYSTMARVYLSLTSAIK